MSTPIKHCAASVMHTKVWNDMRARQAAAAGRGSGNKVGIKHAEAKRTAPFDIKEAAYEKQNRAMRAEHKWLVSPLTLSPSKFGARDRAKPWVSRIRL